MCILRPILRALSLNLTVLMYLKMYRYMTLPLTHWHFTVRFMFSTQHSMHIKKFILGAVVSMCYSQ